MSNIQQGIHHSYHMIYILLNSSQVVFICLFIDSNSTRGILHHSSLMIDSIPSELGLSFGTQSSHFQDLSSSL